MDRVRQYIFIGGTGRCGTNLLKDTLSQSPEVASLPFEYRFTIDPDGVIDFYKSYMNWSPFMADVKIHRFIKFLKNLSQKKPSKKNYENWELEDWFPAYNESIQRLSNDLVSFSYQAKWPGTKNPNREMMYGKPLSQVNLAQILSKFLLANYNSLLDQHQKSVFVEDNTWNILFAKELLDIVPDMKLIHMIRDPRGVIASFLNQGWTPNNFENCLNYYQDLVDQWFRIEKQLPANAYKMVKFENLVNNFTPQMQKISEFTKIPFTPSFENIQLQPSAVDKWKKILTQIQIQQIETQLDYVFKKWDY